MPPNYYFSPNAMRRIQQSVLSTERKTRTTPHWGRYNTRRYQSVAEENPSPGAGLSSAIGVCRAAPGLATHTGNVESRTFSVEGATGSAFLLVCPEANPDRYEIVDNDLVIPPPTEEHSAGTVEVSSGTVTLTSSTFPDWVTPAVEDSDPLVYFWVEDSGTSGELNEPSLVTGRNSSTEITVANGSLSESAGSSYLVWIDASIVDFISPSKWSSPKKGDLIVLVRIDVLVPSSIIKEFKPYLGFTMESWAQFRSLATWDPDEYQSPYHDDMSEDPKMGGIECGT